jgi:hypothetical protein
MSEVEERRRNWRQTPEKRLVDWQEAQPLIDAAHIVTHYPASPEFANIFHASVGDPDAKTDAKWDSPSGLIYPWRWYLGKSNAGFYTSLVRKRPTWVSWEALPALLRVRAERRTSDELADLGLLSPGACRIVEALEAGAGVLSTAELRDAAGFPTGKEHRAAYLKAIEELEGLLILAKVFPENAGHDGDRMSHALVAVRYAEASREADAMTDQEGYGRLIRLYLQTAVFLAATPFARHLRLVGGGLQDVLGRLESDGIVRPVTIEGYKGECFAAV